MDGGNQNNSQAGEKKTQLSWSQPIATPSSQHKPHEQKHLQKNQAPAQPVSSVPSSKNNTFRNVVITIVVLAVIGAVWTVISSNKKNVASTTTTGANATNSTQTGSNVTAGNAASLADGSLSISSPQNAGLEVGVSNVQVTVPTWVVIYENYNGQPGNVLGAGLFMAGRTSGAVDLLRGTLPGQTYFAGESRDDGDHMYSIQNDPAVRDAEGNPVILKFQTK